MKSPTVTSADEAYQAPMKKSFSGKRQITDKDGFAVLIIVLLVFGLPSVIDLILNSKATGLKTAAAVNETHTNDRSSNFSEKVIHDALSSAFKSLNDGQLLIYFFFSKVIMGFCSLIPIGIVIFLLRYFVIRNLTLMASCIQDYRYHFAIVSAGKMISTSLFLATTYFCWTDRSHGHYKWTITFALPEILLLVVSFIVYICCDDGLKCRNESLKSTLRYYISHRYLILFQLLNYTVMLYLMAYVATKLNDLFPFSYSLPQWGIILIIYLMHKYGEMVIIMSKATHGWKRKHETVSLKSILSSMIAISRYHFGTIIINARIVPFFYNRLAHYSYSDCDSGGVIFRRFISKCTMKRAIMFTAIYGQDISKAAKSVHYFEQKGHFVTDFENKTLAVWADVLIASLPITFVVIYSGLSIHTKEDILAETFFLMLYLAMLITYFYVFCYTMNTIENTIEFCKIVSNEDIEVVHEEEQFRPTKSSKKSIATLHTINFDEKQNNKVRKNENNLKITINNNIV